MKVIYNSFIPLRGFQCMLIGRYLFVRNEYKNMITPYTLQHEEIHAAQYKELGVLKFIILYLKYFVRNIRKYNYDCKKAYYYIPMEQEAYQNMHTDNYIKIRKEFAWKNYIK